MGKSTEQYVKKGLISRSDYQFLEELDPSKTKKYLPFIMKSYLTDCNLDLLRNRVIEYDTLLNRNQIDRKDINSFKTLQQLDEYVQEHNNIRSTRELKREIKKEAKIILDTEDVFIVSPQSHAASCLYGASTKWCISGTNSVHWERYYYERFISFYFIEVRGDDIKKKLMETHYVNKVPSNDTNLMEAYYKVALAVYPDGKLEAYTATDKCIGRSHGGIEQSIMLNHYLDALGVDNTMLVPRGIEERLDHSWQFKTYDTELDLSRMGLTRIPDSIGKEMFQLESLILSENKIQTLPESIGLLKNLKTLYLFHNQLTSLPESLGDLKELQWLGLKGNPLSRKAIKEFKRKLPNTRIYTD